MLFIDWLNPVNIPSFDYKTLSEFEIQIFDWIETAHPRCGISLKAIQTKKYLYGNFNYIERLGLSNISDIVGLTAEDLDIYTRWKFSSDFMRWQTNDLINIKELDSKVAVINARCLQECHIFFTSTGLIGLDNIVKLPVFSPSKRKAIAILTYSQDLTSQLSLSKLFELYQKYYPARQQAIQKMLRYLKLDNYFNPPTLPTYAEMQILFAMRDDSRCKAVARKLGCSVITARNHISNLQEKLRPCNLHDILPKLRTIPAGRRDANALSQVP